MVMVMKSANVLSIFPLKKSKILWKTAPLLISINPFQNVNASAEMVQAFEHKQERAPGTRKMLGARLRAGLRDLFCVGRGNDSIN